MRSSVCVLVALFAFRAVGDGVSAELTPLENLHTQGQVFELTDATFDAVVAKYDHILVDFYAPWCGHCSRLSPELDAAALLLAESTPTIVLAKINADKFTKLASEHKVSSYPTLKFFINGFPTDYNGPREASSLVSYLQKLAHPDVTVLKTDLELANFMTSACNTFPFFVGFGLQTSNIAELASQYKSKAWFVVVESFSEKSMVEYDFDKSPALIVLRQEFKEQEVFYGPFDGDDLAQFVHQNILPLVSPLTFDSLKLLNEDRRPIALAILKDQMSEQSASFIKKLKAAAPANRAFLFAYVDASQWSDFTETFHTRGATATFVIWNGHSDYFMSVAPLDFTGDQADSYITKLLQEYQEGKAIRHKLKGPSFMKFVSSHIGMTIVYALIFVVATVVFFQNLGSATTEKRQLKFDRRNHKKDDQRSNTSKSTDCATRNGDLMSAMDTQEN